MTTPSTSPWSAERTETAKRMWLAGSSATEIAIELRAGITRNSVISKVNRMGLTRNVPHGKQAEAAAKFKDRQNAASRRSKERLRYGDSVSAPEIPKRTTSEKKSAAATLGNLIKQKALGTGHFGPGGGEPIMVDEPPASGGKPLLELGAYDCRRPLNNWRLGEGDSALFCAAPVAEAKSYCPACCERLLVGFNQRNSPSELTRSLRRVL